MGLIRKGQSLKIVFLKYLLGVGIGLVVAVGLALLTFTAFYNVGLIVPANHTENQILANKSKISNAEKFEESLIPYSASYIFLSFDGDIIKTNMNEEVKQKAKNFHNLEEISTPSSSFIEIKRMDGYVVINYSIEPHYTNNWMEMHLPKINTLFASLLVVFCFISVLVTTIIWARKLTKQLKPMLYAAEKIAKQDLDFEIGKSNIKEFNNVLNSMNKMKVALRDALKKNWLEEESRRSRISALTHDLKTPISIVQGNAELLKATELTEVQESYVDFILKNSNRISDYSKTLSLMNTSNRTDELHTEKVQVSTIVEIASGIAKEITSVNKHILLEDIDIEDRFLMIDISMLERLMQNILTNAVEYAPKESTIELSILTNDKELKISVSDQGQGFSDEDLLYGTEQFYRADKSRHSSTSYGLGLYISSQIMKCHNGKITLQNKSAEGGAMVTLEFPLI